MGNKSDFIKVSELRRNHKPEKCLQQLFINIFCRRTLLAEINSSSATNRRDDGDAMSVSSDDSGANYHRASGSAKINDKLKIVSTQSTARPGAVVELEPIEDAKQVIFKTLLVYFFLFTSNSFQIDPAVNDEYISKWLM